MSRLEALDEHIAELHKLAKEFGGMSEMLRNEVCRLQGEFELNWRQSRTLQKKRAYGCLCLPSSNCSSMMTMLLSRCLLLHICPVLFLFPAPPHLHFSSRQELLPIHHRHPTKGPQVTCSTPHSHDVNAAVRYGIVPALKLAYFDYVMASAPTKPTSQLLYAPLLSPQRQQHTHRLASPVPHH